MECKFVYKVSKVILVRILTRTLSCTNKKHVIITCIRSQPTPPLPKYDATFVFLLSNIVRHIQQHIEHSVFTIRVHDFEDAFAERLEDLPTGSRLIWIPFPSICQMPECRVTSPPLRSHSRIFIRPPTRTLSLSLLVTLIKYASIYTQHPTEPTTLPTPNIPNKMVMSAYDTRPFKRLASSSMRNIYAGMNVAKLSSSTPIRRHCDVDVFGHVVRVSTTVTKQMRTREAYVQAVAVAWGDNISVVASRVASRTHTASALVISSCQSSFACSPAWGSYAKTEAAHHVLARTQTSITSNRKILLGPLARNARSKTAKPEHIGGGPRNKFNELPAGIIAQHRKEEAKNVALYVVAFAYSVIQCLSFITFLRCGYLL